MPITAVEKTVIDSFAAIYATNKMEIKLQNYKTINATLQEMENFSSDDLNFKNYLDQFYIDLTNFYSSSIFMEICKCMYLLSQKVMRHRYPLKSNKKLLNVKTKAAIDKFFACVKNIYVTGHQFSDSVEFNEIIINILNDKRIPNEQFIELQNEIYLQSKNICKNRQTIFYKRIGQILTHLLQIKQTDKDFTIADEENPEWMEFWLKDMLIAIFETEDVTLRKALITPYEIYVQILPTLDYRAKPFWPEVREYIVGSCVKKLNDLRNQYSDWYRVWIILIKIVTFEILTKASLINEFLSVVELAFRNDNCNVRAQAYICWRNLIEIFAQNNELNVAKRVKLVCIPFKTNRTKTCDIAVNKFRTWWYLITQLRDNINDHIETVFLPFLEHVFGKVGNQPLETYLRDENDDTNTSSTSLCKNYPIIRQMAIVVLAYSIGIPNKAIISMRIQHQLEPLDHPFDLSDQFKHNVGNLLITYCGEVTMLISEKLQPIAMDFCTIIWEGLMNQARYTSMHEHFKKIVELLNALIQIAKNLKRPLLHKLVVEILIIVTKCNIYPFKKVNFFFEYEIVFNAIKTLTGLILHKDLPYMPRLNDVIENVYKDLSQHKKLTKDIVCYITIACDIYDTVNQISLKFEIWKRLEPLVIAKIDETVSVRDPEMLSIALNYLNWSFKNIQLMPENENMMKIWSTVYIKMHAKAGMDDLTDVLCGTLKKMIAIVTSDDLNNFIQFLIIILRIKRNGFDESVQTSAVVDIVEIVLRKYLAGEITTKCCEFVFEHFNNYLRNLSKTDLNVILSDLNNIRDIALSLIDRDKTFEKVYSQFKDEVARKCDKPKSIGNDIVTSKEVHGKVQNDNDVMVTIPMVWKFNPERLTEHQREKLKHRNSDIPALYNDMSQSQDSMSLKPWTPRKLIMPSGNDELPTMVINVDDENTKEINEKENEMDKSNVTDKQVGPSSPKKLKNVSTPSTPSKEKPPMNDSDEVINASQSTPIAIRVSRRRSTNSRAKNDDETTTVSNNNVKILPLPTPRDLKLKSLEKNENNCSKSNQNVEVVETIPSEPPLVNDVVTSTKRSNLEPEKVEKTDVHSPSKKTSAPESPVTSKNEAIKKVLLDMVQNSPKKLVIALKDVCEAPILLPPMVVTNNNKISEMDTEPNTEVEDNGKKKDSDDDDVLSWSSLDGIPKTPINESGLNRSIRSSPEPPDAQAREQDLLDSTLNVSPILNEPPTSPPKEKTSKTPSPVSTPSLATTSTITTLTRQTATFNSPSTSMTPQERRRKSFCRLPLNDSPTPSTSGISSKVSSPALIPQSRFQSSLRGRAMMDMVKKKIASPKPSISAAESDDQQPSTSTPQNNLIKKRPAFDGSPSISILKRRLEDSSHGDYDSPALKRKRVSFHDPPVSETKEYICENENRVRLLTPRALLGTSMAKFYKGEGFLRNNSDADIVPMNWEDTIGIDKAAMNNCSNDSRPSFGLESLRMDESSIVNLDDCDDEISLTPSPPPQTQLEIIVDDNEQPHGPNKIQTEEIAETVNLDEDDDDVEITSSEIKSSIIQPTMMNDFESLTEILKNAEFRKVNFKAIEQLFKKSAANTESGNDMDSSLFEFLLNLTANHMSSEQKLKMIKNLV